MRRDRRDLSSAFGKTGPLLAAGPWLSDVVVLTSRSRCSPPDRARGRRHAGFLRFRSTREHSLIPRPVIIVHDGWYYLLVTDGSGCAAANSSCNIRIGRSRKVTGPFVDNMGVDMLQDGEKLFTGSSGPHISRGYFGLLGVGGGVQKFSCHFEADLDRGGGSVLDIPPLL